MLKQDLAAVGLRGATAGDGGAGRVISLNNLRDAAGGVFGDERANPRVCGEEAQALGERDRMRFDRPDGFERCARTDYETVADGDDDLADDFELALQEKVKGAVD